MIGVIAFVGDCAFRVEAVDEFMRIGDVVALPWTCDQANRKPERIAGGMDFGAQAASRAAEGLIFRPPFLAPEAC